MASRALTTPSRPSATSKYVSIWEYILLLAENGNLDGAKAPAKKKHPNNQSLSDYSSILETLNTP